MASAAERVLVARGYEIAYHDLYAEHFDPVQPPGEDGNVGSSNVLVGGVSLRPFSRAG
jgi:NAD(P)H dehydrogenase (quinone)